VRAAAGALLLPLLIVAACSSPGVAQKRPNVVVIMTDDQTLESMRVMSGVRSRLGASGTTFERAVVGGALCCPSRATFFTGQYTHNHGVLGNSPPDGGYARLDTREWLPVWLQRAGYRTVHIGKFLNRYGQDSPPTEVPPGWSEWYASVDPSTYRYTGYRLNENGVVRAHAEYSTDEYARRAVDAIARLAPSDAPFFLSIGFLAPHAGGPADPDDPAGLTTPMPAPRHRDAFAAEPLPRTPAFDEADVSDKPSFIRSRPRLGPRRVAAIEESYRQELEALLAVDEAVVGIVEALRDSGELGDTLVVFTSDNGFFHGEHRLPNGKVLAYEPSIRVPLVLRGPGVPRGERRRQLVTNADLAPTILDAAHAVPSRLQDGRSLFSLLREPRRGWGRDLLIEGPSGLEMVAFGAVRTYRYLYSEYENGERELYDLRRDPYELRNLHRAPRYARIEAELAGRLAALEACAGPSCRRRSTGSRGRGQLRDEAADSAAASNLSGSGVQ
jgi:N-acetylglucosamine-6-sulfatase